MRVAGRRGEVRRHRRRVEEGENGGERRGMSRAVSPAGELLRVSRVVAVVCLGWHSIELGVNMQRMETVLDWKVVVVRLGNFNGWHFQDVILTIPPPVQDFKSY